MKKNHFVYGCLILLMLEFSAGPHLQADEESPARPPEEEKFIETRVADLEQQIRILEEKVDFLDEKVRNVDRNVDDLRRHHI